MMMGARRDRKEAMEELAGCWSTGVAAAEGKAVACWLGKCWEACRKVSCRGYADGCAGGAGWLVGGGWGWGRAVIWTVVLAEAAGGSVCGR